MSKYSYIINSGWWCGEKSPENEKRVEYGSSEIRGVAFFREWYESVNRHTSPTKIIVVDSASPTIPQLPDDERMEFISMDVNGGHSTSHVGKYAGCTRCFFVGLAYTYASEADYWVYVEQDALLFGEGIVEHAIDNMTSDFMFGDRGNTPQPLQQSMMIIRKAAIPGFLKAYARIKATDEVITPEMKFAIASTKIAQWLPEKFFYQKDYSTFKNKLINKLQYWLFKYGKGYDVLPFGFGRAKPVNFNDRYGYFQHGDDQELQRYREAVNKDVS
ncbi:hypothetical protein [uncultured Kushneria sp.]|uniref:hypothetical protein n=1 Tax=uncultured Kushneria sp. TaxID=905033 RepID=UPI0026023AD6|nr:hypothetical protein [uncultured Kushneria sp.]